MNYFISPSFTESVELDPSTPGTVFRYAAFIEGALNIISGSIMFFFPAQTLQYVSEPYSVSETGVHVIKWVGSLTIACTSQLIFAFFNTRGSIESRPAAYYNLLAGEVTILPLLMANASYMGLKKSMVAQTVISLSLLAAWRLYSLFVKPEWFGRYRTVIKKTS